MKKGSGSIDAYDQDDPFLPESQPCGGPPFAFPIEVTFTGVSSALRTK